MLRETVRHTTEKVRRIARRLRPEALEELGLRRALAALATAIAEQAGLTVQRHLQHRPALTADRELVVSRVAQEEALTNVARHAHATNVELRLEHHEHGTVLTVTDGGRGRAPGTLPSAGGIRGMRERAMLIGATVTIGAPGRRARGRCSARTRPSVRAAAPERPPDRGDRKRRQRPRVADGDSRLRHASRVGLPVDTEGAVG